MGCRGEGCVSGCWSGIWFTASSVIQRADRLRALTSL